MDHEQRHPGTDIATLRQAALPALASAGGEFERAIAEVQASMVIAKKFPRDEQAAWAKVQRACKRPGLAEAALYAYTKGGTEVSGPSIRLAEELARDWGNIAFGWKILSQDDDSSEVRAEAWDLETNVPSHITFTVRHEFKAKGQIKKVTDPREIYELIANQASRRLRACILRVIPGDVQDMAVELCEKTLKEGGGKPLADRVRDMLAAFKNEYGITKEMVEKRIGKKAEAMNETEFVGIARIFVSLRDGMAKAEQFFDLTVVGEPQGGNPTAKDLQRPAPAAAPAAAQEAKGPAPAGGSGSPFTVIDVLAMVDRGEIERAQDVARSLSAAHQKQVATAIEKKVGNPEQEQVPAAAAQQQQDSVEEEAATGGAIELEDVLEQIRKATDKTALDAAGTLIDQLAPEDQDVARRRWMKRQGEVQAPRPARRRSIE